MLGGTWLNLTESILIERFMIVIRAADTGLNFQFQGPCGACLSPAKWHCLGSWIRQIYSILSANECHSSSLCFREKEGSSEKEAEDPGDSEPLSNLLGRLQIHSGMGRGQV